MLWQQCNEGRCILYNRGKKILKKNTAGVGELITAEYIVVCVYIPCNTLFLYIIHSVVF
jgi:hypothetical protein